MKKTLKIIPSIATIFCVAMLFSCQGKLTEVRKFEMRSDAPQATGKGINLFYTDSGKVLAHLKSPLMKDFSNQDFPYREFPEGLEVEFFNETQEKNTVTADYGIIYSETGLVDLQGNVEVITPDSVVLKANQLYWDQNREWVFTDISYTIKLANGALNKGEGFDANQKFDNFISRSNIGVQYIEEGKKDTIP